VLERPNGHNTVGKEAAFYAVEARAELQRLIASAWHRRRLSVPLGAQPSPRQAETNEPLHRAAVPGRWTLGRGTPKNCSLAVDERSKLRATPLLIQSPALVRKEASTHPARRYRRTNSAVIFREASVCNYIIT
jgi:hypothetical protein